MDTRSGNKKTKRDTAEKADEGNPTLKIVKGIYKNAVFASVCLLVPESLAPRVLDALKEAPGRLHDWTMSDDESLDDISGFPKSLAYLVCSSINGDLPSEKSESELLGWLIHGDSGFQAKYLVLEWYDPKDGPDDGYCGKVAFAIEDEKYLEEVETLASDLVSICPPDGDLTGLVNSEILDLGKFKREFGEEKATVLDDDWMKEFRRAVEEEDTEWAWENRGLVS